MEAVINPRQHPQGPEKSQPCEGVLYTTNIWLLDGGGDGVFAYAAWQGALALYLFCISISSLYPLLLHIITAMVWISTQAQVTRSAQ